MNALPSSFAPEHMELFDSIGLLKADQHFNLLVKHGKEMLSRSLDDQPLNAFARDFSALSTHTPTLNEKQLFLIIDIGGSHTKAGLVVWQKELPEWLTLFDIDNNHFNSPTPDELPINRYIYNLAGLINDQLHQTDFPSTDITAVGIIWSNAITCRRFEENQQVSGVSGLVTGIAEKKSYRKGEFFVDDLYDGFNLSTTILNNLARFQIIPKVFVIGNDTIFTLKATTGAHAGMVASTGANATAIDSEGWIYNTEMGGLLTVPNELLSAGDDLFLNKRGQKSIVLEDLIAGKWLPDLFQGHLHKLAKINTSVADFVNKADPNKAIFSAADLSELATGEFSEKLSEIGHCCPNFIRLMSDLIKVMARRAGKLASAMAYLSLPDFLDDQQKLLLSLDSSQARFLPGYYESLCKNLNTLLAPNKEAQVVLQSPQNEITVPMRGLAASLAGELAQLSHIKPS